MGEEGEEWGQGKSVVRPPLDASQSLLQGPECLMYALSSRFHAHRGGPHAAVATVAEGLCSLHHGVPKSAAPR